MSEMIKLKQGHVPYAQFDFFVEKGEKIAILGPSGAGKSTLLNLLAGFLIPDPKVVPGYELWLNQELHSRTMPGKRPISMLFQSHNLIEHLSIFQNIALGIKPNMKLSEQESDRLLKLCQQMKLDNFLKRRPEQLSGGQQQRVALARALLRSKPILLLDEPFSALDRNLRHEMIELVNQLTAENHLTTLMVTHNDEDAKRFAHRLIYVDEGKIRHDGDVEQILNGLRAES